MRIQETEHGRYEIGTVKILWGGCYKRFDNYISKRNPETEYGEQTFVTGMNDDSDVAIDSATSKIFNIRYDANCACCFLGFSHSVNYHNSLTRPK